MILDFYCPIIDFKKMAKRSSRQESISTAYDRYHHYTNTIKEGIVGL